MKLIIIRGPSGSGKSTLARHLGGVAKANWFEADMFFMRNGIYQFDPDLLGHAHEWCQSHVRECLTVLSNQEDSGLDVTPMDNVIVSNTSTTLKELNDYIKIGIETGVSRVEIIRTPEPWIVDKLLTQNTHRVPRAVLEKQIKRYTPHDHETEWADRSIFHKIG
jgi:tRNA uridine 5-carbamoylmethylation protein Kti12